MKILVKVMLLTLIYIEQNKQWKLFNLNDNI